MLSTIGRTLGIVSIVLCLTVFASFAIFALDQTTAASDHQQQALAKEVPGPTVGASGPAPASAAAHESAVRRAIDDVAGEITSPFSPITSGSSSEWAVHGVNLLLAMIVYGFGIGYLARWIRVRV